MKKNTETTFNTSLKVLVRKRVPSSIFCKDIAQSDIFFSAGDLVINPRVGGSRKVTFVVTGASLEKFVAQLPASARIETPKPEPEPEPGPDPEPEPETDPYGLEKYPYEDEILE